MKNIKQFITLIFLLTLGIPVVSSATIINISAIEDSGILDGVGNNDPFPGILYSELDTLSVGNVWLSILKFDLSSLSGMTVNSANFELTSIFNHNSGTFSHEVFSSSDDSWTEGTVTGLNRPLDSTLSLLDSTAISGISQTYTWDVLTGVLGTDGLAGTNDFLTLVVRPELSQAGTAFGPHFNDRTSSSNFPVLILDVTTSNVPSAVPEPTSLALLGLGIAGIGFARKRKC